MKIVNELFLKQIDFALGNSWFLIIENEKEYFNNSKMLINQINGDYGNFSLSENNKTLELSKNSFLIYDYFNLGIDSKSITSVLNKEVLSYIKNNDYIYQLSIINNELLNIVGDVKEKFDLPLEYNGEFVDENITKIFNFNIEIKNDLLNDLLTLVDFYIKLKNIKLFIFINISSVLTEKELNDFIKQMNYSDVNVLFIEPTVKFNMLSYPHIIIDKDLCEI